MMRVAHVIKVTNVAGAETHLLTLLSGLKARQIDAQLILLVEPSKPMDDYVHVLAQQDIPVYRLKIRADFDPTLVYRLRTTLRMIRPYIVHTHLLHADLHGVLAAKWAGVPLIVTSRHNDNAFRRREPFRSLNRFLWRTVNAGIAISDSIAQFAVTVESASPPKIQVIRYGLDYQPQTPAARESTRQAVRAELAIADDTPLAGIVCRLVAQKGVSFGLKAFAQVTHHFPEAQLVIVGDGPLRADLEAEVTALGLAKNVRFVGWRSDVPRLMTAFDLLLMPSLWEGFGLVILEAMSRQLPLVASAVSAIPEIVAHGETGLLVPPRDVDALSEALIMLFGDPPLRRYMGMLAEDRLETHFTARRMVDETAKLYGKLV